MQHTKEPWPEAISMERECGDSYSHFWRIKGVGDFESQDDAERARACVNACAGIEDVSVVPLMVKVLEAIASHDPATCGGIAPRDCLDAVIEAARSALRMMNKPQSTRKVVDNEPDNNARRRPE